jgi:hypothetical protein
LTVAKSCTPQFLLATNCRMRCVFSTVSFFILISLNSSAQDKQIVGRVIDNTSRKSLQDASVILMKKDSFIVAEKRSNEQGNFVFDGLADKQTYLLFVSYPRYASYSTAVDINLNGNNTLYIKDIELKSQTDLLQEVIFTAKLSNIKVRGDTVEYSADRIKLPPNSTVEDMLKVLPGLHVDNKGQITAQGKRVRQVFVDGEEFFSDDPCLVTRNLRANMVGTVQVYDKKSDAANFTGMEDGIKNRVINLKLKEDKNNGMFGKIEAGAGPGAGNKTFYSTQAMLNLFKPKQKASAYFSSNNIGQMGLGSSDKDRLGIAFSPEKYDGKGLPGAVASGLHFDNKWNKDKTSINGDYNFSFTRVKGYETVFSQNNLPTGIIDRNYVADEDRKTWTHKANVNYKQKIDSTASITVYAAGAYGRNNLDRLYNGSDKDGSGNFLNLAFENTNETHDFRNYALNVLLQKKLKKPGRTISVSWESLLDDREGQQTFFSATSYYNSNQTEDTTKTLNFLKKSDQHSRKVLMNVSYTERMGKTVTMLAGYNAAHDFTDDDNRSLPVLTGSTGDYDRSFSTIMINDRWAHTGNLQLNYSQKKERISAGGTAGVANMAMNNKIKSHTLTRQFQIWKPVIRYQHNVNNNTNFNITYRGNTITPEFQQMLPYSFNNTQLVTYLENPDLSNSFSNNFCGSYESFRNFTKAFTAINVTHTIISNPIVLSMNVDKGGNYSLQYVNMPDYSNSMYEITGFYSRPINKPKMQLTVDGNIRGGKNYNFLNGAVNKLNYKIYSLGLFGSKNQPNKYDVYLGATASYNSNRVSANKEITDNNFFSFSIKPAFDVYFLKNLQLHSDADYLWQSKSEVFAETFDRFIWNAWVGGSFLRNKQLTIKIACNDILNANKGISRLALGSFFTESKFITIQRYFMVTAQWNFTKFKMIK